MELTNKEWGDVGKKGNISKEDLDLILRTLPMTPEDFESENSFDVFNTKLSCYKLYINSLRKRGVIFNDYRKIRLFPSFVYSFKVIGSSMPVNDPEKDGWEIDTINKFFDIGLLLISPSKSIAYHLVEPHNSSINIFNFFSNLDLVVKTRHLMTDIEKDLFGWSIELIEDTYSLENIKNNYGKSHQPVNASL